jgi:hypothetical protein
VLRGRQKKIAEVEKINKSYYKRWGDCKKLTGQNFKIRGHEIKKKRLKNI